MTAKRAVIRNLRLAEDVLETMPALVSPRVEVTDSVVTLHLSGVVGRRAFEEAPGDEDETGRVKLCRGVLLRLEGRA